MLSISTMFGIFSALSLVCKDWNRVFFICLLFLILKDTFVHTSVCLSSRLKLLFVVEGCDTCWPLRGRVLG